MAIHRAHWLTAHAVAHRSAQASTSFRLRHHSFTLQDSATECSASRTASNLGSHSQDRQHGLTPVTVFNSPGPSQVRRRLRVTPGRREPPRSPTTRLTGRTSSRFSALSRSIRRTLVVQRNHAPCSGRAGMAKGGFNGAKLTSSDSGGAARACIRQCRQSVDRTSTELTPGRTLVRAGQIKLLDLLARPCGLA
jgi:hypothetical protein